ncbi:hypothetical protein G6F64_015277 [Rhizopus arrhizus]|uniref:Secreted protein n=1 Tax=Rhizopus oryzae TaxID=64495 RepID=A0A9P6WRV8_RHIOR|nr:hypothetical protein G6F64_015277 [Rhizopus arrhizus]
MSAAGPLRAWAMWPAWTCSAGRTSTQTALRWLTIWMASPVLTAEPVRPLRSAGMASITPEMTATATKKTLFLSSKNCRRSTGHPEVRRQAW